MQTATDFVVTCCGSIITFTILSDAAREFVDERVAIPAYAWIGTTKFCADHRPGALLAAHLDDHGFALKFRTEAN